jgi:hypothetical protein
MLTIFDRCTADKSDLNGTGGRRSRDHTELLVTELELGTLWDEYGLVGDIIVSFFRLHLSAHCRNCAAFHQ